MKEEQRRPHVLYDASRLCTRVLNATPNGIDRLDALLARHFLSEGGISSSALVFGLGGPRLLPSPHGLAALERAEQAWNERDGSSPGDALARIIAWLQARSAAQPARIVEPRRHRIRAALEALRRVGLRRGADPAATAPPKAVYLNTTHFPLEWPSHVAWLSKRSDVRFTLLIHDLLPSDRPEFFWKGEPDRHRKRLDLLARRGAGAIVTTRAVEGRLRETMERAGRTDLVIRQAWPPVAPVFHAPAKSDPRLGGACYFLTCGTIEPRKNHRLLLSVWRQLIARFGTSAPKLVVVGKRGWLCDDIIAEMHGPALSRHVLEVSGLASADYRTLLDHARALLAPSFAEGFGLPVAEALTAGTPVIASDIDAFREIAGPHATLVDPMAADDWLDAIEHAMRQDRRGARQYVPVSSEIYLAAVDGLVMGLA